MASSASFKHILRAVTATAPLIGVIMRQLIYLRRLGDLEAEPIVHRFLQTRIELRTDTQK